MNNFSELNCCFQGCFKSRRIDVAFYICEFLNRVRWFISIIHASVFFCHFCTFFRVCTGFMMHLSKTAFWYLVCHNLPLTSFFLNNPVDKENTSVKILKMNCFITYLYTRYIKWLYRYLISFTFDALLSSMLCTFGRVTDVNHPHPFTKSRTLLASLTWACPSGSVMSSYRMMDVFAWNSKRCV